MELPFIHFGIRIGREGSTASRQPLDIGQASICKLCIHVLVDARELHELLDLELELFYLLLSSALTLIYKREHARGRRRIEEALDLRKRHAHLFQKADESQPWYLICTIEAIAAPVHIGWLQDPFRS